MYNTCLLFICIFISLVMLGVYDLKVINTPITLYNVNIQTIYKLKRKLI